MNTEDPQHQPHHEHYSSKPPRSNIAHAPSILISLLVFLALPILIAFFLTAFVIQSYQVDGQSMQTTLNDHDRLLVDKIPRTIARIRHSNYIPNRGDIVIFNQSGLPDSFYQKQLIKRVIGLPGERVVVKNGFITIYNSAHPEGFNPDTTGKYTISAPYTSGDINVLLDSNEIFVCGDNRGNSEDSRFFGPVNAQNLVGKLVIRLLPLNDSHIF